MTTWPANDLLFLWVNSISDMICVLSPRYAMICVERATGVDRGGNSVIGAPILNCHSTSNHVKSLQRFEKYFIIYISQKKTKYWLLQLAVCAGGLVLRK